MCYKSFFYKQVDNNDSVFYNQENPCPSTSFDNIMYVDESENELVLSDSSLSYFDDERPSSEPKRIKYCPSIDTNPERPCSAPTDSNVSKKVM